MEGTIDIEREWAAPGSEEDGLTRCTLDESRTSIPHHPSFLPFLQLGSRIHQKTAFFRILLIRSIGSLSVVDTQRYTFVRATYASQSLVNGKQRT